MQTPDTQDRAAPAQVVITGASGLVGGNLAALLTAAGHTVRCTRRKHSRTEHLAHLPIEWVTADLLEPQSLEHAFRGAAVVFNCAADVRILSRATESLRRNNIEGSENVVRAVRAAGVPRLVHCSSVVTIAVAEGPEPVSEDAAWNLPAHGLTDGYAETKRAAEEAVLRSDVDAVVVNPAYMLGPLDARPSSGQLILNIVEGKVPGYTDGFNNFVDVRDVGRGMIAAWQRGRRGERYILGGHDLTYRDIMQRVAQVSGCRAPSLRVPRALASVIGWFGDLRERLTGEEPMLNTVKLRYAYCRGYRFSSDKARRELGYSPGPIEPAIADALSWFRTNGLWNGKAAGKGADKMAGKIG
jgi:dihydroflavonol-4-reductase